MTSSSALPTLHPQAARVPSTPAIQARDIGEFYEIDDSQLKGTGAFSRVVVAKHRKTGQLRAVKVMELAGLVGKKMEMVQHEKEILRRADHPSIIRLHDCIQTADKVFFAMDLMKGDLFDYIVKNKPINEKDTACIMRQLVSAVDYLHDQSIVHRDIKPENVLINSPQDVKLADFGLAKIVLSQTVLNTPCGTSFYIAPEIISGIQQNGARPLCTSREDVKLVDLWSLGVVMYIMLSGRPPFAGQVKTTEERRALLGKIDAGVLFPPQYWATISEEAKDLIVHLLSRDVHQRVTAKQALDHPFLRQAAPATAAATDAPAAGTAAPSAAAVDEAPVPAAAPTAEDAALAVECRKMVDDMRDDGDEEGETTAMAIKTHAAAGAAAEPAKPMARPKLAFAKPSGA